MSKGVEAMDPAPPPITASDAMFLLPPPSYDQVMGAYQTSVKTMPQQSEQQSDVSTLAYIDIMPRCLKIGNIKGKIPPTFDNFSAIMEGANKWLKDNPGMTVWKCETVIRRIGTQADGSLTYDLNEMLRPDPTFGYVVYIRGLRMWLTRNTNPGAPTQQLGLRNELPGKKEELIPVHTWRGGINMLSFAGEDLVYEQGIAYRKYYTFKNLYETIDSINEKLASDPIPGSILTVETDFIKAYELFKRELDPETACWTEDKMKFRRETQVVRIFYVLGNPARETIGIKDFVPELIAKGTTLIPAKFENFDTYLGNVANWIPANPGIRIVNIQQTNITVDKYLGGEVSISPDDTDETVSTFQQRRVVQLMRVFYVKSPSGAPQPPPCISSRVFTPARIGATKFETMTQTMERIDAWLKVTGIPIFSLYTFENLFNEHRAEGMDLEKTDYVIPQASSKKWLTAIRVFFPTTFQEPDPSLLPPGPKNGSSSCTVL